MIGLQWKTSWISPFSSDDPAIVNKIHKIMSS